MNVQSMFRVYAGGTLGAVAAVAPNEIPTSFDSQATTRALQLAAIAIENGDMAIAEAFAGEAFARLVLSRRR